MKAQSSGSVSRTKVLWWIIGILVVILIALVVGLLIYRQKLISTEKEVQRRLGQIERIMRSDSVKQENFVRIAELDAHSQIDSIKKNAIMDIRKQLLELGQSEGDSFSAVTKVIERALTKNKLSDDFYLKILRDGKGRDIELANNQVSALLYLLLGGSNTNSDRFSISQVAGKEQTFLIDKARGNAWIYKNDMFKIVEVQKLEEVRQSNELRQLIDDLIESTKGSVIDLRTKEDSLGNKKGPKRHNSR